MKKICVVLSMILLSTLSIVSCVKKDFDAPPDMSGYDPQIPVTMSLAQLKAVQQLKEITDDVVVYGVVTADDRSGNFYKQIVIQDSTGGMTILIDGNSLYNDYPIGRKIYIKCKGLYLGNYNDLPQLGYTPDETGAVSGIPITILDNYIVKANHPNTITPKVVSLSEVAAGNVTLLNTIITIKDVEFDSTQVYKKYADPAPSSGTSRTVKSCDGSSIIIRTSGYAKFQPVLTPAGRGTLTGIYTMYKGTPQLVIRDTSDVKFTGVRCNGVEITPPAPPVTVSLKSIRDMYTGTPVTVTNAKIKAVVISDKAGNNTSSGKLMTIQDGTTGIIVFFSSNHNFAMGDSLLIDISGASLSEYGQALQITNIPSSNAEKVGSGFVTPKQITLAALAADFEAHESTLVKIVNATVAGGGTYQGNKTLTDGSGGSISLYTTSSATFRNDNVPTTPKAFTGIVGQFNSTLQLQIRNLNDVQ